LPFCATQAGNTKYKNSCEKIKDRDALLDIAGDREDIRPSGRTEAAQKMDTAHGSACAFEALPSGQ
jgi:poly-beta-hydroxyalkanoate depolymerase